MGDRGHQGRRRQPTVRLHVGVRGEVRRARESAERGSVLVEAAIIVPLLMLLTFGAIEFGIGFSQKAGLQSLARAGARTAATLTEADDPTATKIGVDTANAVNAALGQTSLPKVEWLYVYRLAKSGSDWVADGFDGDYGTPCGSNCIRFPFAGDKFDATSPQGTWPANAPVFDTRNACSVDADRVGVTVQGKFTFLTGLVGSGFIELKETSVLQLEPTNCL
jgi:hypothetical protein